RALQEARAQANRSVYSLQVAGRLQAMESTATGATASPVEAPRREGEQAASAALKALERADFAVQEAQRAPFGPAASAALARAQQDVQAARAQVASGVLALEAVNSPHETEAER